MENSNGLGGARIALLIDFDNVILGIDDPGFDIELVVNALRERGTIVVSRVYGDWYRHNRHRRRLMEHGVELVEAPAFGPVIKNSADIKIALDGYEIGMTMPHINTFCLVSGDSDFLPLIKKLQGLGKNVLVICGNRFTSDMLRRNCNEFISYENLLAASYGADEDATTLEGAFALLHRAMAALRERGSEIRTSTLKQMMIQLNPVFSEKTFGYNQFRGFLDKAGRENLIKLGPRDRVSGEFYVLLPEEDEAEVIEKVERAEPAEKVEKLVESRNGRRDERESQRRRKEDARGQNGGAETPAPRPAETEMEQRPRSRREARLLATREQERQNEPTPSAAPLATPLTPATDFSPADSQEAAEISISREELISRGLRRGRRRFSGRTGRAESVETPAIESVEAQAPIEPDIALVPDEMTEEAPIAADVTTETPADKAEIEALAAEVEAEPSETKSKRSRSRRRKKSAETAEIAPVESEVAEPEIAETPVESPPAQTPATDAEVAPVEEVQAEEQPKPKRTRRRKKAEEAPAEIAAETEAAAPAEVEAAPAEVAEEKPKRRRRTSRKKAEDIAEVTADVTENIVTTDQTTGEVSQNELAEIPVPVSQDEV